MTPTLPGHYWYRHRPRDRWIVVEVCERQAFNRTVLCFYVDRQRMDVSSVAGEWSERLEEPGT